MTSAITLAIVFDLNTCSRLRTAAVTCSKHADRLKLHLLCPNIGQNRYRMIYAVIPVIKPSSSHTRQLPSVHKLNEGQLSLNMQQKRTDLTRQLFGRLYGSGGLLKSAVRTASVSGPGADGLLSGLLCDICRSIILLARQIAPQTKFSFSTVNRRSQSTAWPGIVVRTIIW